MIDLPDPNDTSRVADWLELFVLTEDKAISKSKAISLFGKYGGNLEEAKVDGAMQELVRRLTLYGKTSPYTINNNVISPNFGWRRYPEHSLCLIFSLYGAFNSNIGTKLFEQLIKSCLDHFLNAQSIGFGFPSGISFKTQIDSLATKCSENRGDDPTSFDKDRGVDLVLWKSYNDGRNGSVYMLVQCAAGGKWNTKKAVPLPSWRRYISWNLSTTIPAIAITQIVEVDKWANAVDDYGIVIDRARIFRTISSKGYQTDGLLKAEIVRWCKDYLK